MMRLDGVTKKFDKRGIAGLHGVNLSLEKGEVLAITGPNGSGKTTLLKIVSGELAPDGGSVFTDSDVQIFAGSEELPSLNVQNWLVDQVRIDISDEKKIQLTRDLADTFEFTFQLRQNLTELSSGQKQKVLLASKLINRPSLFLMDEPFAHLDPFTRTDILKNLFQYLRDQEITLIWVTHDLEEAFRFSDLIAVMNFGRIEQFSSPLELLRNPRNLFTAQFIGYRNFFTVKKEQAGWASPWGTLSLKGPESDDALLVVPDHSWKEDEGGVAFEIRQVFATKQELEYELELAERTFHWKRPSRSPLKFSNKKAIISPVIEECFLISL